MPVYLSAESVESADTSSRHRHLAVATLLSSAFATNDFQSFSAGSVASRPLPFPFGPGRISLSAVSDITGVRFHNTAEQLLLELNALHFSLTRLDGLFKSDVDTARQFDDTLVIVVSTHACKNKLYCLLQKLVKDLTGRSVQGRASRLLALSWPLDANQHRETIGQLKVFAQWIQFALSIDGCALLSRISAQVCCKIVHR